MVFTIAAICLVASAERSASRCTSSATTEKPRPASPADAAGQTLAEIGHVSKTLATLIADISAATQNQAEATSLVAETMQDIKAISAQTSAGTRQTAESIGGMKQLAQDLKKSVAGFKLA